MRFEWAFQFFSLEGQPMKMIDALSTGWKAWIILLLLPMVAAAPGVFNLPALDRDESRFAQASKQMLETGDYIRIQYQDELRNKKPAGIHWLQAGATAALGDENPTEIWTYRVPSWIGAGLAGIACFWCGIVLVGRRAAFIGAALFGSTMLLTSEAHISKTDGVLVFLTTLAVGALVRLYMVQDHSKRMALIFWVAVSTSFLIKGPVTMLVVGFAGFGAWVWQKYETGSGGNWWRPLAWWPGPAIFVAMVLPWFIWIQTATNGAFFRGAVGKDLKDKFAGASEGHAGWALYHLTHIPAWFFPATLLILPACWLAWKELRSQGEAGARRNTDAWLVIGAAAGITALAAFTLPGELGTGSPVAFPVLIVVLFGLLAFFPGWRERHGPRKSEPYEHHRALRFLVAWGALTFIFFEVMPTRLSHYVLPAYPAMGLLCGWAAVQISERGESKGWFKSTSIVMYAIGGLALLFVSTSFGVDLVIKEDKIDDFKIVSQEAVREAWAPMAAFPMWLWLGGAVLFGLSIFAIVRNRIEPAILLGIAATVLIGWHVRAVFLPSQLWIQSTETARIVMEEICVIPDAPCPIEGYTVPERISAVGHTEPSYVMTFGTQNPHPPETLVELPDDEAAYPVAFLINIEHAEGQPALDKLTAEAEAKGVCMKQSSLAYAINYSNNRPAAFRAVRFDPECLS